MKMKRMTRFALIILVVIMLAAALAPLASAAEYPLGVVTTPVLNVRSGPGPGYSILTTVHRGDLIGLMGRDGRGSWLNVVLVDGTQGWVSSLYVNYSIQLSSLPITAGAEPWGYVNVPALNFRNGPGFFFEVVSVLPQGKYFTMIGRDASGNWLEITVDGMVGWVASGSVYKNVSLGQLPVTSREITFVPATGSSPTTSTATTVTGITTVTAPGSGGPIGFVTTPFLNVRIGPGAGYVAARTAAGGDALALIGRNTNSSWLQVQLDDGFTGWVSSAYINSSVRFSSLPIVAEAEPVGVINIGTANVRSGPGLSYASLTTADQGRLVNLIGRTSDSGWLKVRVNGVEGWVAGSLVNTSYRLTLLPVAG